MIELPEVSQALDAVISHLRPLNLWVVECLSENGVTLKYKGLKYKKIETSVGPFKILQFWVFRPIFQQIHIMTSWIFHYWVWVKHMRQWTDKLGHLICSIKASSCGGQYFQGIPGHTPKSRKTNKMVRICLGDEACCELVLPPKDRAIDHPVGFWDAFASAGNGWCLAWDAKSAWTWQGVCTLWIAVNGVVWIWHCNRSTAAARRLWGCFLAHSYGTFVMSWVLHFRTLAYLERSGENLR